MVWTSFFIGIFVGANIGVLVAGMLYAAKRHDAEDHSTQTPMDYAVMGEIEEIQGELPPLPKPVTYLDRYPHS